MSTSTVTNSNFSVLLSSIVSTPSSSLKPTTTVVRKMPIIAEGWEDAAVNKYKDEKNEVDEDGVVSKPKSTLFLTNFMTSFLEAKNSLKSPPCKQEVTAPLPTPSHVFSAHQAVNESESVERLHPERGWQEAHGFLGDEQWELPVKVKHCDLEARPGYASKLAHEYSDTPQVLHEKVKLLAQLLLRSENCLLYTGAGLSTASGIGDYATRMGDTAARPRLRSPYEAQPTYAHRALVALYNAGVIKYWVQQNHDGLPQKAGLPQKNINEIHGAWYDPSNPVVPMAGALREDLFRDLLLWEQKADLALSMGTSMCGMNSDRVFTTAANKGRLSSTKKQYAKSIGGVIINRQQTQFDQLACLRIFGEIDVVMAMLLDVLNLETEKARIEAIMGSSNISDQFFTPNVSKGETLTQDVYLIPYDERGNRCDDSATYLDLRDGSKVRLTSGPYQGDEGVVLGKNREGHLRIQFRHLVGKTPRPFESVLGSWWVQAAVQGDVPLLPLVNINDAS